MSIALRKCRFVLIPIDYDHFSVLEHADIIVEDGRIACIGDRCEKPRGVDSIDCSEAVAIPAFGNAHTHAAMVSLRGYADDYELFEWLDVVWRAERFIDSDAVRYGTRLACIEMSMGGVGAFQDMYYHPEVVAEEARRAGLRVRTGPIAGMHSLDLRPWLARSNHLFKPVINVHALYTLDRDVLEEAFENAKRFGVDVHIHLSETRREVYLVRRKFGYTPVEVLERMGWLSDRVVAVHLNWVTSWELQYLARSRAKAVICPVNGGKLAVGSFPPFREMIDAGIVTGMGSDGACSANRLSILTQVRTAILLYRLSYWDTRVRASNALYAATVGSYLAMGFEPPTMRVGAPADIAIISLRKPWMRPARSSRVLSEVAYSAEDSDVVTTIVGGRIVWSADRAEEVLKEVEHCEKMLSRFIDRAEEAREKALGSEKPPFIKKS
ncbi:MAG: amidohydrolase family protein [Crenarchaeota archaeon]|nr:amidohydrolase family protein [Thermoproteota archaeon]